MSLPSLASRPTGSKSPRPPRPYYRSRGQRTVWGRGPTPRSRRPSWRPSHRGLPPTVPVWTSAADWLRRLAIALALPEGARLRHQWRVAAATVLDVAAVDARAADHRTGRNLATSHATVARVLGCSTKTVQRARGLIEALGYARTVVTGRYLTAEERRAAHDHHGGRQIRMASTRALTCPRVIHNPTPPGHENVHLPRRGHLTSTSPVDLWSPNARERAKKAAAARRQRKEGGGPRRRAPDPPPLTTQRLAAKLIARLPHLGRGHSWTLCRALIALGITEDGWSVQDILDALEKRNHTLGRNALPAHLQRNPVALFIHQMRHILATTAEAPRHARTRETAALRQAQEADRQRIREHRTRIEAERADPTHIARRKAARNHIRSQLQATTHHQTPVSRTGSSSRSRRRPQAR